MLPGPFEDELLSWCSLDRTAGRPVILACGLVVLAASMVESADGEPALLLLTSGRVVSGRIRTVAGAYQVDQTGARLVIPFAQVQLAADSLADAYRKLRRTMPQRTANRHIGLARWCIGYGLVAEARAELRAALVLEPDRDTARRMLTRLEPRRVTPTSVAGTPFGAAAAVLAIRQQTPEAEALGGLSRESAREFVLRVQPLLSNKCGNASCHGPRATNEFRLTRVVGTRFGSRVFSERNLAAVLKQIDLDRPADSPLLRVPRGEHGNVRRPVFDGRPAAAQIELLRRWVEAVARERRPRKTTSTPAASTPIPAAPTDATRADRPVPRSPSPVPVPSPPRPVPAAEPAPSPAAPSGTSPDAFAPDVFNRETERRRSGGR